MAEYVYTINDFSLTTTWTVINATSGSNEIQRLAYNITSGAATKTFTLSGLTLGDGEKIKKAVLSATLFQSGTADSSATISVNGVKFGGNRKFDSSEFIPGGTWDAAFYFRASGEAGTVTSNFSAYSFSSTLHVTDVTLTITTGTGSVFDGKVSSLNEGDKILIDESGGASAFYTLMHHEYNAGKALIFRDTNYGTSTWGTSSTGYIGSALNRYLTNTFYPSLPATTTQFLQTITYPISSSSNNNASNATTIDCVAATISAMEAGVGGSSNYGSVLNYTDTVANGETYWTRECVGGMSNYSYGVNASGSRSNWGVSYSYGVRPTLGVSEEQLVRYSDTDSGYVFCTQCSAPDIVYIDGNATDMTGLNSEANLTLSWSDGVAGYNSSISGYAVWYSTSVDGEYELYGTTTGTSMTIIAPKKGHQQYYFKVQTLAPEEIDYCNSELSSDYRVISTKNSNVYYYDGTTWKIAIPKHYNGSSWEEIESKYYDGIKWNS